MYTILTTARLVLLTRSVKRRALACRRTSTGAPIPCTRSATDILFWPAGNVMPPFFATIDVRTSEQGTSDAHEQDAVGLAKYCGQNSTHCDSYGVARCAVASLRQTLRRWLTAPGKHVSARREAEGERVQFGRALPAERHGRHVLQLRDCEASV